MDRIVVELYVRNKLVLSFAQVYNSEEFYLCSKT